MQPITAKELSYILENEILPRVEKPSRYLGCEVNAVRRVGLGLETGPNTMGETGPNTMGETGPNTMGETGPNAAGAAGLRVALAFPDLYDLGLPNLGILILYEALNRLDGVSAERVYAPGLDLEAILHERGLPLFSLESRTPLAEFDCIGFTLQYELCYTNVLNMLDLAGIPPLAAERGDDHPIVIAGGPCALNPEPMAPFIDAFGIGEGEDVIVEIADALTRTKGRPRAERLSALAGIEGVYVPALYDTRSLPDGTLIPVGPAVRKRVVADLDEAPFPTAYIVPFTQQVHDRVSLEVLRGCTQGCRFCHAGMTTRPVRERSLDKLREMEEQSLRATGYEEVALASLSTCDYSRVKTLVRQSVEMATPWGAAVSLPSLRLDSFSMDLSEMVQNVRKTGLTFAPEAATPRMRAVINKWIPDEELLEMTGEVYRRGWEVVKLYFMIGLPTETDEDVAAIADLSRRVLANGRRFRAKARVNLGVATFIPKPHTPFQWEEQISPEETLRRQQLLNANLRSGLKFGRHDAAASYLEGVFSRGDRRLGAAILDAWRRGCRMDAWGEHLDLEKWHEAFAAAGIDPDAYLRARDVDQPLPWDHIDTLVTKEYLRAERERSRSHEPSIDCRRQGCRQCGAIDALPKLCVAMLKASQEGARAEEDWQMPALPERPALNPVQKLRFRFTKEGPARFLSHLELLGVWTRALRRAEMPLAYSQGFHPQPKLAFGTALALGTASEAEVADVVLNAPVAPADFAARLNRELPQGIVVTGVAEVPLSSPSLMAQIAAARYRVELPAGLVEGKTEERVAEFLARESFPFTREGKKGKRTLDLRALVAGLSVVAPDGDSPALEMTLREGEGARARPAEIVAALLDLEPDALTGLRVLKLESYLPAGEGFAPVLNAPGGPQ